MISMKNIKITNHKEDYSVEVDLKKLKKSFKLESIKQISIIKFV